MAVDTYGLKGEPQFLDLGEPDIAVDDNAVSKYAADYGNYKVGTTSQRTADTVAGKVWQGLQWLDTSEKRLYWYDGGWKLGAGFVPWAQSVRPSTGNDETYQPNRLVGIHSITIPNAPTGVYEWSFTVSLSGQNTTAGEIHVQMNGAEVTGSPYVADRTINIRTLFSPSGLVFHQSGNLTVSFLDFVRDAGGRFHGPANATLRFVSVS